MTVLAAAITKQDGVVIAADSEITWESAKSHEGPTKLWIDRERKYVFGGAGDVRVMQVIKHWVQWPEFREHHKDIEEFMVKEVVPVLKDTLSEHGVLESTRKVETFDATIIMAWADNLVCIDGNFSVTIPLTHRWAAGSGENEAFGSLGVEGPWTKNDIIKAARNATTTAIGVSGDIHYVTTKALEIKTA
jgi:ATP-dependent protease HslVU (ClpYQ) peptidase subunit